MALLQRVPQLVHDHKAIVQQSPRQRRIEEADDAREVCSQVLVPMIFDECQAISSYLKLFLELSLPRTKQIGAHGHGQHQEIASHVEPNLAGSICDMSEGPSHEAVEQWQGDHRDDVVQLERTSSIQIDIQCIYYIIYIIHIVI